ncbi:hypothetical protein [Piscinibacter terrae]|uniref:Beta-lactamase n=1 Tax=Piscinibacter terrae TaxID=2496871 RepID=A0A3N7HMW0_9BURK|nr:hypothetical protein [Albitalea terrae]RQP22416.1 hypothetical protein DZC73_22480 [Albitalea terrae]
MRTSKLITHLLLLACSMAGASHAAAADKFQRASQAAHAAATANPACLASRMGDFYWEIGDASGVIASGSTGRGHVTANSEFAIASASKWVFGAYVLEKKGISAVKADASLLNGLRFTSGYTDFHQFRCIGQRTVGACMKAGFKGDADPSPNPDTQGRFVYQGGHDQKIAAIDMGLGALDAPALMQEMRSVLHLDERLDMAKLDVQLAGGMKGSAASYAPFLQRMLRRELVIGSHLGEDAVCAQPATCPREAISSPVEPLGEPWSYSYNHWVETPTPGRVEAYSSPGLFGFYPWISADQRFYGIVSRHDRKPKAYVESVECGRAIRRAFVGAL